MGPCRSVRPAKMRLGFTLVELLVVIAIIGVLVGLLLPAVQAAREAARRMQCSNNLKQIGLAMHMYHDTHLKFPPGAFDETNHGNRLAWTVFILPFQEQMNLYNQFNFSLNTYAGANLIPVATPVNTYLCPSSRLKFNAATAENPPNGMAYTTHYYGLMGAVGINSSIPGGTTVYPVAAGPAGHGGYTNTGILYRNSSTRMGDISDGTSSTFLVGELSWERANCFRSWGRGASGTAIAGAKNVQYGINIQPYSSGNFNLVSFGSEHTGGAQFGMGDGSVRFTSQSIDMGTYLATVTRGSGEVVKQE